MMEELEYILVGKSTIGSGEQQIKVLNLEAETLLENLRLCIENRE